MSGCNYCHLIINLKVCGNCGRAQYCGKQCQIKDWRKHKHLCKQLSTSATASSSAKVNSKGITTSLNRENVDTCVKALNIENQSVSSVQKVDNNFANALKDRNCNAYNSENVENGNFTTDLKVENKRTNDIKVENQTINPENIENSNLSTAVKVDNDFNMNVDNKNSFTPVKGENNSEVENNNDKQEIDMELDVSKPSNSGQDLASSDSLDPESQAIDDEKVELKLNNLKLEDSGTEISSTASTSSDDKPLDLTVKKAVGEPVNMDLPKQLPAINFYDGRAVSQRLRKAERNLRTNLNGYCERIASDMNRFGFCILDNFGDQLDAELGDLILDEVLLIHFKYKYLFKPGQLVNKKKVRTAAVRRDETAWLEPSDYSTSNLGAYISFLVRALDTLVSRLNAMFKNDALAKYDIRQRTKAMIACYPGGGSNYVKHVDNPGGDGRCVTTIFYLNKDYEQKRDGGLLQLFPTMADPNTVANIEPIFKRLLFFWSDKRNPHLVQPSMRMRYAMTVWYFDDNERDNYRAKNADVKRIEQKCTPFVWHENNGN